MKMENGYIKKARICIASSKLDQFTMIQFKGLSLTCVSIHEFPSETRRANNRAK